MDSISSNTLKNKAQNAKKRIASGKWMMIKDEGMSEKEKHYLMTKKYVYNNMGMLGLPYTNFDKFFDQVYNLLSIDLDYYNPIKDLVNTRYYNELSQDNKQRYIFNISKKYIFIKRVFISMREKICLDSFKLS